MSNDASDEEQKETDNCAEPAPVVQGVAEPGEQPAAIRATLFDEAVTQFAAATTPGSICSFSGGRIKLGFAVANTTTREKEITFGADADIHVVNVNTFPLVSPSFPLLPLADLARQRPKAPVNIIGILLNSSRTKRFLSAQGNTLTKRELVVVDETRVKVFCTLWGNYANDDLVDATFVPVLIKGGQTSDYRESHGVSAGVGSMFMVSPMIPRADELSAWWASGVDSDSFPILKHS